jgi:hypothetical protein
MGTVTMGGGSTRPGGERGVREAGNRDLPSIRGRAFALAGMPREERAAGQDREDGYPKAGRKSNPACRPQNGRTITRMTTTIISTVGTSLAIR